jgi:secreted PhoX family phosphatase
VVVDDIPTNTSQNRPFADVFNARVDRRSVLRGGAIGVVAFFIGDAFGGSASGAIGPIHPDSLGSPEILGFHPIPTGIADTVALPKGYVGQPFMKWGDPIDGRSPAFRMQASNPASDQERQLGQGHDGMHYFPLGADGNSSTRGLIAVNHEYTLTQLHFADGDANWDAEKTRKEQAGHGVSVVEVALQRNGEWALQSSSYARRITPNTTCEMTGPARGHRLVVTNRDRTGRRPRGIVNQCGAGKTPWGTYLTTEENFNVYFWEETNGTSENITDEQAASNRRYGVGGQGAGYRWATTDDLWRADLDPNRPNTFGYMVEIDPYNPDATPQKHSALGRFKHEGATFLTAAGGEVVVYMGDDQRFDYIYKFVSAKPWASEVAAGRSPLTDGTLYCARFNDDGTGEWLPLVHGVGPLTAENGFANQGDVVIKARIAADLLAATPMDRPEWTTSNEVTGDVFCTLTNNSQRTEDQTDAPNPRGPNLFGHIIKWNEGGDAASRTFDWEIFLIGGGGRDSGDGSTIDAADAFGSPDGLWLDPDGILWIQTDGGQPDGSNNQVLACDPTTKEIKRFAVGPRGCEVTGVTKTPDGTTLFINIQHPGDGGTPGEPTKVSTWPDGLANGRPRPATVAIRRIDGGVVGT